MPHQSHHHTGWRGWIERYPSVAITFVTAALIAALTIYVFTGQAMPTGAQNVYYYDMEQGELFEASPAQIMPIVNPNHPESAKPMSVQAHVFGCGGCSESQQFIGYLETHNPNVVEQMKQAHAGMQDPLPLSIQLMSLSESPVGHLIKAYDNQEHKPIGMWYARQSTQASQFMRNIQTHCEDATRPERCEP